MSDPLFNLSGLVAVVTGGGGVLTGAMAREMGRRGVRLAVGSRTSASAKPIVDAIIEAGGEAMELRMDVTDRKSVMNAAAAVVDRWGRIDILVNGAGGNRKDATASDALSFFDIPEDALRGVMDLNLHGTIFPCQAFGKIMAAQKSGAIINVSSASSLRPLTKVVGYSAAKAAVNNFTQWLAVYMAVNYSPAIRVNAIAPGFFETEQNRFLLRDALSGELSDRGRRIVEHTPAGRFGTPDDLSGALVWLASPASSFVTGAVIPVDGGFSAYTGV